MHTGRLEKLMSWTLAASLASGGIPITTAHASTRQLVSAGGQPIVDCAGAPARLARLERGMPVQREALRRLEQQLRDAQAGNLQALRNRDSADVVRGRINSWLDDQKTMLAEAAAARLTGLPPERISQYREKYEAWNSAVAKVQKAAGAGYAYGEAIRQNAAALKDFMKVLELLDDSGIGEEAARLLARSAFGPAGDLAIDGFNLARDWALAELGQNISDLELGGLRDAYYGLVGAVMNNEERIANLRASLASCPGGQKPQVQESPRPIPPQETPAPARESGDPAPTAKKSGPSRLGLSLAIGMLAAGGGALAISKALNAAGESGGGTGAGGAPTIVNRHEPWICAGNRCTGQLTIDFPGVMSSGTITVGTDSLFLGQRQVNPSAPPGRVTFDMEKSPYLTCYGTQTTVAIWNSAFTNTGPPAYQLQTSIRVECR